MYTKLIYNNGSEHVGSFVTKILVNHSQLTYANFLAEVSAQYQTIALEKSVVYMQVEFSKESNISIVTWNSNLPDKASIIHSVKKIFEPLNIKMKILSINIDEYRKNYEEYQNSRDIDIAYNRSRLHEKSQDTNIKPISSNVPSAAENRRSLQNLPSNTDLKSKNSSQVPKTPPISILSKKEPLTASTTTPASAGQAGNSKMTQSKSPSINTPKIVVQQSSGSPNKSNSIQNGKPAESKASPNSNLLSKTNPPQSSLATKPLESPRKDPVNSASKPQEISKTVALNQSKTKSPQSEVSKSVVDATKDKPTQPEEQKAKNVNPPKQSNPPAVQAKNNKASNEPPLKSIGKTSTPEAAKPQESPAKVKSKDLKASNINKDDVKPQKKEENKDLKASLSNKADGKPQINAQKTEKKTPETSQSKSKQQDNVAKKTDAGMKNAPKAEKSNNGTGNTEKKGGKNNKNEKDEVKQNKNGKERKVPAKSESNSNSSAESLIQKSEEAEEEVEVTIPKLKKRAPRNAGATVTLKESFTITSSMLSLITLPSLDYQKNIECSQFTIFPHEGNPALFASTPESAIISIFAPELYLDDVFLGWARLNQRSDFYFVQSASRQEALLLADLHLLSLFKGRHASSEHQETLMLALLVVKIDEDRWWSGILQSSGQVAKKTFPIIPAPPCLHPCYLDTSSKMNEWIKKDQHLQGQKFLVFEDFCISRLKILLESGNDLITSKKV